MNFYTKSRNLEPGKPYLSLNYMKNNDVDLYSLYSEFHISNDLHEKLNIFKSISKKLLDEYGGFWQQNETIYHLTDYAIEDEIIRLNSMII
jgi:hypothetical protein